MTSIHYQRLLASIFLTLGAWCMCFPGMVERLVLKPAYLIGNDTSALLMGCFGAQAVLCGTVILCSRFTPKTLLVFGLLASIPFFGFNYYFYVEREMFTHWMLLDFAGNVGILTLSLLGYAAAKRERAA